MRIVELVQYPVKSLGGQSLRSVKVTPAAFGHDRRWMVVDAAGQMLTQRTHPQMATVHAEVVDVTGPRLRLTRLRGDVQWSAESPLVAPQGPERTVRVWGDTLRAREQAPDLSQWLSAILGVECFLVAFEQGSESDSSGAWARSSFADGAPILLTSKQTIDALREHAGPLGMDRFRPNIVVDGDRPWAEETWTRVEFTVWAGVEGDFRVRTAHAEVLKPCRRCSMLDVHPRTGAVKPGVFATLRTLRALDGLAPSKDGKPYFGVRLGPLSLATTLLTKTQCTGRFVASTDTQHPKETPT